MKPLLLLVLTFAQADQVEGLYTQPRVAMIESDGDLRLWLN